MEKQPFQWFIPPFLLSKSLPLSHLIRVYVPNWEYILKPGGFKECLWEKNKNANRGNFGFVVKAFKLKNHKTARQN